MSYPGIIEHHWVNCSRAPFENTRPVEITLNAITLEKGPAICSTNTIDSEWDRVVKSIPGRISGRTPQDRVLLDEYIRAAQWDRLVSTEDRWAQFCPAAAAWRKEAKTEQAWIRPRLHRFAQRAAKRLAKGRASAAQPEDMGGKDMGAPEDDLPAVDTAPDLDTIMDKLDLSEVALLERSAHEMGCSK